MTNLVLFVDEVQHPSEPLNVDYSSPFGTTRLFETQFRITGIQHDDRAHMITLEIFMKSIKHIRF